MAWFSGKEYQNKIAMRKFTSRILGILLIVFLLPFGLKAQQIGIIGGLNASSISTDISSANEWRAGYQAGLFGKFMFGDSWSFQPRLLYSTKGSVSKYDKEFLGGEVEEAQITFMTEYISVPLLINFNPYKHLNFYIGPFAGILMSGEVKSDMEILQYINVQSDEGVKKEDFNNIDAGLKAGFGLEADPFILGIEYSFGFMPVADQDRKLEMILEDANNNTLALTLGILF